MDGSCLFLLQRMIMGRLQISIQVQWMIRGVLIGYDARTDIPSMRYTIFCETKRGKFICLRYIKVSICRLQYSAPVRRKDAEPHLQQRLE